jgi:predicted MarR family transcription regulator
MGVKMNKPRSAGHVPMTTLGQPNGKSDKPGESVLHFAQDAESAALARLEMGLMRATEAFTNWAVELHRKSSGVHLAFPDIALLHSVRLRGGTPSLSEMLLFMHRHDLAALQYSFRKLERHGFVKRVRGASKREVAYQITALGREATDAYSELRHQVLIPVVRCLTDFTDNIHDAAAVIERMIGLYDQAVQALLNEHLMKRATPKPAGEAEPVQTIAHT